MLNIAVNPKCDTITLHLDGRDLKLSQSTVMEDITPYEAAILAIALCVCQYSEFDFSKVPNSFLRHFEVVK